MIFQFGPHVLDLRHMELSRNDLSILKTLAHFDVLDYPLTLLELAKFNELGLAAPEIYGALYREPLSGLTGKRQGLFFLKGRDNILVGRLERYRIALLKLKRARKFAKLLAVFPWVRGIAVYSSLSLKNSRLDGDIDLFIIAAAGRVWSARFWLNVFLKLFRLRPTAKNSRDKLCASYLADEVHLDLSFADFDADYFYAFGGTTFLFLSASYQIENEFWQANGWIKKILPAWQPFMVSSKNEMDIFWTKIQSLIEITLGLAPEKYYKNFQINILPKKYLTKNDNKKVALQDGIIKLHDNDKRGEYNRLFAENYEKYIQ